MNDELMRKRLAKWEQLFRENDVMPVLAIGFDADGYAFICADEDKDVEKIVSLLEAAAEAARREGIELITTV